MRSLHFVLLLVALATIASCRATADDTAVMPTKAASEDELRRIDLRHAQIAQSGDVDAAVALLHPAYTAHLTNGRISNYSQTLAFIRSGAARERFDRVQETVIVTANAGLVMGLDKMEMPPPLADRGQLNRRYTNVYVREGGRWRLLARHFHLLP